MKPLFILLILFTTPALIGQIEFEEGYFINNMGEKLEGYINNADWTTHPKKIDFKTSLDAKAQTYFVADIQEFALDGGLKYKRFTVDIDQSLRASLESSTNPQPIFERDQVMLQVLVEGTANLYVFVESGRDIFFIETEPGGIQQLIYKKYQSENGGKRTNYEYRRQLSEALSCEDIGFGRIRNLPYSRTALVELLVDYHECKGGEPVLYKKTKKKGKGNVSLMAGIDLVNLTYTRGGFNTTPISQKLDAAMGQRVGLAGEFILPTNNNRWSIFAELSFLNLQMDQETPRGVFNIDYKSLEIAIGVRHNFFLNEKNRIYLNAALAAHSPLSSTFEIVDSTTPQVDNSNTFVGGLGYRWAEKIGLEVRFSLERDLLNQNSVESTKMYTTTVVGSYVF